MVHVRLNERESNPNPYINFISVLDAEEEDARRLIRALAAQVKPVMKTHGFTVNSLEEYEYNKVFAGRNWNNGETVELVLRSVSGSFLPTSWLMNTLCHELAHIKHMNHGSDFQNLWKQLRNEVRALQNKGYYGDGYWSAGTRLADSSKVTGQGIEFGEFPEYMCGGAQQRARPTSLRRRRGNRAKVIGPSLHSGRQTAKKRKAGTRVTSKYAFAGDGKALNEDLDEDQKKKGIGFRKQAGSKRAREERALAAERRIMALQSQAASSSSSSSAQAPDDGDPATESDDSDEEIGETDQDRRKAMLDASQDIDIDNFKYDFPDDFDFNLPHPGSTQGACDLLTSGDEGSTFTNAGPSRDNGKANARSRDEGMYSSSLLATWYHVRTLQQSLRVR
ncbi:hypothetical protein PILCRDRAFT_817694 [Piloderma croceum F 1598]|uniref:WLM domain-containing protein n=1 Tax=Piloderma croceum (strain F 1598) TaxID=765440 RepID=A0A0C3FYY9_PILCF|nr:hypothetical protein PILCRDRAFT_817694 [Piloderma croceum F 1598]